MQTSICCNLSSSPYYMSKIISINSHSLVVILELTSALSRFRNSLDRPPKFSFYVSRKNAACSSLAYHESLSDNACNACVLLVFETHNRFTMPTTAYLSGGGLQNGQLRGSQAEGPVGNRAGRRSLTWPLLLSTMGTHMCMYIRPSNVLAYSIVLLGSTVLMVGGWQTFLC